MRTAPRRTAAATALLAAAALANGLLAQPAGSAAVAVTHSERVRIGTSVQGRPILAYHRWQSGASRRILVIGNIHGDEKAGLRVIRKLRRRPLPAEANLWLIPTVNPDGNAADRRTNAHGVDLNRNFPRLWVYAGSGTPTYSGPKAASEPETRALAAFVRERRPWTTVVLHQPLFGVDSYRAKSMDLIRALSRRTGLPVKSFSCSGGCHGTFTEWHNDRTRGRAVTVEFGRSPSAWRVDKVATAILRVGLRH